MLEASPDALDAGPGLQDRDKEVLDASEGDATGEAVRHCPSSRPQPGACDAGPQFFCDYGVDGGLLPNFPPCYSSQAYCLSGQWAFAHNDPGTPQCGWPSYEGGTPDECSPEGGVCIDPTSETCATGLSYALVPCPYPKNYCCSRPAATIDPAPLRLNQRPGAASIPRGVRLSTSITLL